MIRQLLNGMAAGAVGTTALHAVTYLDMVIRGRPTSTTPEDTMRKFEKLAGVAISADGPDSERAANRRAGLGALLGIVAGVGTGAVYGVLRPYVQAPLTLLGVACGVAANVGTTGPMVAMGVTDPRDWSASSWISDIVPHLAYGWATAAAFEQMNDGGISRFQLRPSR